MSTLLDNQVPRKTVRAAVFVPPGHFRSRCTGKYSTAKKTSANTSNHPTYHGCHHIHRQEGPDQRLEGGPKSWKGGGGMGGGVLWQANSLP